MDRLSIVLEWLPFAVFAVIFGFGAAAAWRAANAVSERAYAEAERVLAEARKSVAVENAANAITQATNYFVSLAQRQYQDEIEEKRRLELEQLRSERTARALHLMNQFLDPIFGGGFEFPGWTLQDRGWDDEFYAYRCDIVNEPSFQVISVYMNPEDGRPLAIASCEKVGECESYEEHEPCTDHFELRYFPREARELCAYLSMHPKGWFPAAEEAPAETGPENAAAGSAAEPVDAAGSGGVEGGEDVSSKRTLHDTVRDCA